MSAFGNLTAAMRSNSQSALPLIHSPTRGSSPNANSLGFSPRANSPNNHFDFGRSMRAGIVKKMLGKLTSQIQNEFLEEAVITAENLVETCKKDALNMDTAYEIADCCYRLGMYKNCVAILEQIRPIDDRKVPKVQNLKGMAYQRMGNFEYANELYELSLIEQPDYVNSLNNMGNLCMRKKLYEKANSELCVGLVYHESGIGSTEEKAKLYYVKSKKMASRLNNKAVACYNLALVCIHTDDMIGLYKELLELEQFLTPDMYVYKNIMETGFDHIIFKGHLLHSLIVLEELAYSVLVGQPPTWSKKVAMNPKIIQLEQYLAAKPTPTLQTLNDLAKPELAKKPPSLALGQLGSESNALMSTDRRQPVVIRMKVVNSSSHSDEEVVPTNKAGSVNFNVPSTTNSDPSIRIPSVMEKERKTLLMRVAKTLQPCFREKIINLDLGWSVYCSFALALVFITLGIVIRAAGSDISTFSIRLDDKCGDTPTCSFPLYVKSRISGPIYVYLHFKDFYVQHRASLKSVSHSQLAGEDISVATAESECVSGPRNKDLSKTTSFTGKTLDPEAVPTNPTNLRIVLVVCNFK